MKSRVLIIDDEEGIRYTFKNFLSHEGYEVVTAEDYATAREAISKTDFDLVIADIILGKHTGIDILRQVKSTGSRCCVIMVTGQPDIESAADAVRLGAFDYLPKPIRRETLIRVTKMALQHKALLDERDQIEAEKDQYRKNLEAIFRSLKDAILTVDSKGRIIEANQAVENTCGFSPKQIIGKKFSEIQSPCLKSCHRVLVDTLKSKKTIDEYRIECSHDDRPRQIMLLSCSPLTDRQNRFMGAVLVARDITRLTDLERELRERHQFHNIIGKSKKMQEIYRTLEDLVNTDTTVLITGESGTGKELVAKALHYAGIRANKPLVKVNCSALAENLLESELFGHVKGAFTGAIRDKKGRFELANGGSILLDEIGDMSPRIQLRLLRVLQEREIERVGDSTPIVIDVRVLAATNRNLVEKVRQGEFREDLYYRLKVIEISLPPLRDRREDIVLFIDHFCGLFNKRFNKNIEGVSENVLRIFMRYPWHGNVRELEHAIEHAFVLCRGRTITVEHLPAEISEYTENKDLFYKKRPPEGPENIINALNKTDWNKAKAARLLGISRQTVYRTIEKYKLLRPSE